MGEDLDSSMLIILFVFICMLIGGIFREINKKTHIPYTPMLFTFGMIFGYNLVNDPNYQEITYLISEFNPDSILFCFLPALIFDSAQNINWHQFKNQIIQIIILAVPCVVLSAIFIMISLKVVLNYDDVIFLS